MFHRVNLKDYLLKVLSHLILGKGPTQGLEHTLTAEKMYSINFMVRKKKFCISLHYNRANSYLFDYGREIYKFRAKDPEIIAVPLCLGNIPKDWSADNIKKKDLMVMFMILVLSMILLMLMIMLTFIDI